MHFTFRQLRGYLRAELFGRQTVEQTLEFVEALSAEARRSDGSRILVMVRNSRPIFKVEQYKISEQFRQLAKNKQLRVALLADSDEVRASHQYIEVLASQQGAQVRAFRDEARALDWLVAQSQE
jgi:hypothetical protein